jgi:hypothetical protein
MNKRKIYLRKKENRFVFETKIKGRTTHLITLPTDYEKFLRELCRLIKGLCPDCRKLIKSSFFSKDKWLEIEQKLVSADYRDAFSEKQASKVPPIKIMRTSEKDALK